MKLDIRLLTILISFSLMFTIVGVSETLAIGNYTRIRQISLDTYDTNDSLINSYELYGVITQPTIETPSVSLDTSRLLTGVTVDIDKVDASSSSDAVNKTRISYDVTYYSSTGSQKGTASDTIETIAGGGSVSESTDYYSVPYAFNIDLDTLFTEPTISEGEYLDYIIEYQVLS